MEGPAPARVPRSRCCGLPLSCCGYRERGGPMGPTPPAGSARPPLLLLLSGAPMAGPATKASSYAPTTGWKMHSQSRANAGK